MIEIKDKNQFFPTPFPVAKAAARYLSGKGLLLEPSAGHGDLLAGIRYGRETWKIKCVEIDPDNVAVLKAAGYDTTQGDFLEVNLPRIFDAVLMNPPFNAGVKHILKAWGLLKQGGELVAIINKTALENDTTSERRLLSEIIKKQGHIQDIGNAFDCDEAERKAIVGCAIVYIKRHEYEEDGLDASEGLDRGQEVRIDPEVDTDYGVIKSDFISASEEDYKRGIEEVFKGLKSVEMGWKILNSRFGSTYSHNLKTLGGTFEAAIQGIASKYGDGKDMQAIKSEFVANVRALAWMTVLDKTSVKDLLYSQDQEKFVNQVMTDSRGISFTKQNICGFVHNIFTKRQGIFSGAVKRLFNELRRYHDGNTSHIEGWKTNKSWKVPQKIILPYGVTYEGGFSGFRVSYHKDYLDDLDRVVRVLDNKPYDYGVFMKAALEDSFKAWRDGKREYTEEVETKYFRMRYFKKGTLHIIFKDDEIRARLNMMGADGNSDLPDMNR